MIVVATTTHNVPTCKATWITWPNQQLKPGSCFFPFKTHVSFPARARGGHEWLVWHWATFESCHFALCLWKPLGPLHRRFGRFFLIATSVDGPVLSVNSMVAMILRYCMYCWFLDVFFGWFVDGLLQSLKFIYSCFIHGLQIIQVMPSFDFGKIFSVDIFKDPKFHRVHSYIYTHLFEYADIYKLCVYTYT